MRTDLKKVDRTILRFLRIEDPFLSRIAVHFSRANGKRVRPILVLLTARHLGRVDRHILSLAATVEMLHAASLVHDDILDNASIRRHQKTLNYLWGNELSVLMGDFVFAAAFRLMSHELPPKVLQVLAETAGTVCRGQIQENLHRCDVRLTEEGYTRIIGQKTASLISACCETSALLMHARPSEITAFRRFGHLLGLAFQITDDTLDYTGRRSRIGKPVLNDMKEGRVTLPVIHCLRRSKPSEQATLRSAILRARKGPFDPAKVLQLLVRYDSIEYARRKSWDYIGQARSVLSSIPGRLRPEDLLSYSEYLVRRDR